jgi:DeoR family transcriptional regulator, glycerol-3-phosphate regulon repressor
MSQTFRHPEILEIARREGKVTVERLADHFGVTLQTIRRDLSDLAETGRLQRVHGGAVLPSGTTNIAYEERRSLNHDGKAAIARACARASPRTRRSSSTSGPRPKPSRGNSCTTASSSSSRTTSTSRTS